jgi:hypothetical protein
MSTLESIEQQVAQLDPEQFAQFRDWFLEFEADAWDRQIVRDARAGKLDALAQKALNDHQSGRTTSL